MTSSKNTKRALFTSVLAVLMCVAMLVGTTFAWFTDTASTAVNKIVAGNLHIELQYATAWDDETGAPTAWANAEGKTLNFKTADGRTTGILWEPDCRYVLPELRIVNKGNLALKYNVVISGIAGDSKLNEVIDWEFAQYTIQNGKYEAALGGNLSAGDKISGTMLPGENGDATDPIMIKGHMLETADNNYQSLYIDGVTITVYATQFNYEKDSFGDDYDEEATFPIGTGTAEDPYLIHNTIQLSTIKNNGTYKYYKVADGIKEFDCTGVSGVKLFGEFDGNGVILKNIGVKSLFQTVGNGKDDTETTVLKNFTAVMNGSANSLVFTVASPSVEFNNVKVSGYMEGNWNMGAFVNYGTANYDDTGFDYTLNFVNCACNATIVSKQNNSAAILVGHTYPGTGKAVIRLDGKTDSGIAEAVVIARANAKGYKYYGVGNAEVYVDGSKISGKGEFAATNLAEKKPAKQAGGNYTVEVLDGATVKAQLTAQFTAFDSDGNKIANLSGITFTLGESFEVGADGKVFDKIDSIEIINERTESNRPEYTISGTVLKIYTNSTDNYITGSVSVTTSQYNESGVLCAVGTLKLAEKNAVDAEWTIK